MNKTTELEKEANLAARLLMGEVGWPTILLGLAIVGIYITTLALVVNREINLVIAYIAVSLLTYAMYTVLHEAIHGSIQGKQKSYSWVNSCFGYLGGQILFIPFKIHQQEHLAHHRHTNKKDHDPDLFIKDDRLISLIIGSILVTFVQYKYFFTRSWQHTKLEDKLIILVEILTMISWRIAFITNGLAFEALVLFVFGTLTGIFITVVLFVWLVHRPHDETERYKNTNTIIMPQWSNGFITWLWLYQNYHSIHHLFPRVPFYKYKKLFETIEPIMRVNGAPIIRVGQN